LTYVAQACARRRPWALMRCRRLLVRWIARENRRAADEMRIKLYISSTAVSLTKQSGSEHLRKCIAKNLCVVLESVLRHTSPPNRAALLATTPPVYLHVSATDDRGASERDSDRSVCRVILRCGALRSFLCGSLRLPEEVRGEIMRTVALSPASTTARLGRRSPALIGGLRVNTLSHTYICSCTGNAAASHRGRAPFWQGTLFVWAVATFIPACCLALCKSGLAQSRTICFEFKGKGVVCLGQFA
jgi:hypothetical protein